MFEKTYDIKVYKLQETTLLMGGKIAVWSNFLLECKHSLRKALLCFIVNKNYVCPIEILYCWLLRKHSICPNGKKKMIGIRS